MDSAQAIQSFWSGFGWAAYDQYTVPSQEQDPEMPRITYEVVTPDPNYPAAMSASLWDKSYSWHDISKKAQEIFDFIGRGGCMVPFDGGCLWIKRGTVFSQRMSDTDDTIRRIYLTIEVEYLVGV